MSSICSAGLSAMDFDPYYAVEGSSSLDSSDSIMAILPVLPSAPKATFLDVMSNDELLMILAALDAVSLACFMRTCQRICGLASDPKLWQALLSSAFWGATKSE